MRCLLAAALVACFPVAALPSEARTDGPVVGGSFGMGGADYFGDVRDRMPFTQEAAPQPIGIRDMERVRAARRRADSAARHVLARRSPQRRPSPHG